MSGRRRIARFAFALACAVVTSVVHPSSPSAAATANWVPQTGHAGPVNRVRWSDDGLELLSAGLDGSVCAWDPGPYGDGLLVRRWSAHRGPANDAAWVGASHRVASVGADRRLWLAATGTADSTSVRVDDGTPGVIAPLASGAFALAGTDSIVELRDAGDGHVLARWSCGARRLVALAADGTDRLVGLGADGVVREYDPTSGTRSFVGRGTPGRAAFDVATRTRAIAWIAADDTVRGVRPPTDGGGAEWSLVVPGVTRLVLSPDGRRLATCGAGDTLVVWDLLLRRRVVVLGRADAPRLALAFDPDGRRLATGDARGAIVVWDLDDPDSRIRCQGRLPRPRRLAVVGSSLFVLGEDEATLERWDLVHPSGPVPLSGVPAGPLALAVATRGDRVAAGTRDGSLALWASASDAAPRVVRAHADWVADLAFDRSGTRVLSAGYDDRVRWTDARSGEPLATWRTEAPRAVAILDDSVGVVGGARGALRVVALRNGATRATPTTGGAAIVSLVCEPGGRAFIAGGLDGVVVEWCRRGDGWSRGRSWSTGGATLAQLAIDAGGSRLAMVTTDGGVFGADLGRATGEARRMASRIDGARTCAFGAEGRVLFVGSESGTVTAIDPERSRVVATLASDGRDAWTVATPEGWFDGEIGRDGDVLALERGDSGVGTRLAEALGLRRAGLLGVLCRGETVRAPGALPVPEPAAAAGILVAAASDSASAEIRVDAAIGLGAGDSVRVLQDGRAVGTLRAGALALTVPLAPGPNHFEGVLARGTGEVAVKRATVDGARRDGSGVDLYVLAIGIDAYRRPGLRLSRARDDARAIGRFFERRAAPLPFRRVIARVLVDGEATRANVLAALDECRQRARVQDAVLVFFAGHGMGTGAGSRADYAMLMQDAELGADGTPRAGVVGCQDLTAALRSILARKQLVILDACESGLANPFGAAFLARGASPLQVVKDLARAEGQYLIAASGRDQQAYEVPGLPHSLLTEALLSGLGEDGVPRAATEDGLVTVDGLLAYLRSEVPKLMTRYLPGRIQEPYSLARAQGRFTLLVTPR